MKRMLFLFVVMGVTLAASGQKSRVLSVFQMIESGKYEEAKEAVELAVWNDKTSRWHRTYYAKGLLCQTAFEAGFEKNDAKKTGLYPDQLVVAYTAYERALDLDSRGRLSQAVAMQYYGLANDFQKLGQSHFAKREYARALDAFEHALMVSKSELISAQTDTNLVYNTAMAAYEARKWDKAISYLTGLNDDGYSPNTALLLYHSLVQNGDSTAAEQILVSGVERYGYDENIILQLVDLLVGSHRPEKAVELLNAASERHPDNHIFPWTCGLVYQRMNLFELAIESLSRAASMAPGEEVGIYYNLGICYYNIGVTINESAREIKSNLEYKAAKQQALEKFRESVNWLEKAFDLDPADQQTISKLSQLYYRLQMTEKQKSLEMLLQ